jgi:hypothetical protein
MEVGMGRLVGSAAGVTAGVFFNAEDTGDAEDFAAPLPLCSSEVSVFTSLVFF